MSNKANTNIEPSTASQPVAWIGLDWGHFEQAFALEDQSGQREEGKFPQSAETLHEWLKGLEKRFGGRPVALGIEASRGAVIHALVDYPWLMIYAINPASSAYFRQAFTPSGASDDLPDARVLLEMVRTHPTKFPLLTQQDPQTRKLAGLTELRRRVVDRRTQLVCQGTDLLRSYFPQALELFDRVDSRLAIDLLRRWPDLISLKTARPKTLKQFFHAHNVRRPELVEARLEMIAKAVALTTDEVTVQVATRRLSYVLDQLEVCRQHVEELEKEIELAFDEHPNAQLFRNLPGAGAALAPRLCAVFGTVRDLYPKAENLQKHSGVAPVVEKSGKKQWTHWRRGVPAFIRQTLVEWAAQTVQYSVWAALYYKMKLAAGMKRQAILRSLAFKWVRVLWKCWRTDTPYNETLYLEQLRKRKSPYAPAA